MIDRILFRRVAFRVAAPVAWIALLAFFGTAPLAARPALDAALAVPVEPGSIAGRVVTSAGQPVTDAEVRLVDLRRRVRVGEDGSFRFDDVRPGERLVEAVSPQYGSAVARVTVPEGGAAEAVLTLDLAVHREEIVVTASPDARGQGEIAQPTSVLSGEELQRRLQPTLGETLDQEPGVSSTYFGPGASRPVVRGLGGDRVRILQGGLGAGDASSTSPDHAVSVDPLAAERIEVLRGPATLLYGSSAVGGVVNVIDNRIPDSVPSQKVSGTVELRGGTVAEELSGAASLNGGQGRFAWHLDALKRETDDYEIPGFAESRALRAAEEGEGDPEEEVRGTLENSATETEAGSLGFSYVTDAGFLGVSAGVHDTLYGIPGGHHEEEGEGPEGEEEEEAPVRIDLEQRRYDLRGGLTRPFLVFRGANLRLGVAEYEHVELEGAEVGTRFLNDSWEGRLELLQRPFGLLSGSVGLQASTRDFEAIGEEAFVPPTVTDSWALFTLQEVERGDWRWQLGGRYERQDVTAEIEGENDRSFSGFSGSLGAVWAPDARGWALGLSVARSVKLPNAEELFSNGPHIATNAFEIGDPDLDREVSLGVDATLRKTSGPFTGELTLFANRFDDFIYEQPTPDEEDGLPVFRYVQRDAEFYGAELTGVLELFHAEPHHVDLELGADLVRAELSDTGEPLPRIPPASYRLGVHYHGERLTGLVEAQRAEEQRRTAELETPTDGHTFLNASVGYRIFTEKAVYDLMLRGRNLTDEEGRNHVSFLKERVPLPGRDVSLAVRVTF
jgi:iron complex outermembrane recepter protein